jgi:uncharacterized protein (TIGR00255 family)
MIRSMTGFGAAEGTVGTARVAVELRSVNHRFFNTTIKLPGELARWEVEVRDALRRKVTRGHLTVSARIERGVSDQVIDEERFGAYVALLRRLRDRFGLAGDVDVATVLRMPDVLGSVAEDGEGQGAQFVAVVEAAATALAKSKEDEGNRLATYLRERLGVIEGAIGRISVRAPERLLEHRERLKTSVRELAEGIAIDEQRLAMEIAVLADRLDVQEELSRFRSHLVAFTDALDQKDGDPVGKRLGFVLQEMLREANTTGNKANDAAMLREVVTIKEELERIREQVENLE